jgi:ribosomal protein S18 acetylase RimI-like enzyme
MGAGKKLIEEAKYMAREKGVKRIKVEAAVQNKKALTFYRSCGFEDFDLVLEMDA